MGFLGGRAGLVLRGGGEWGLVVRFRPVASPRSSSATVGALATSASEKGQGEVGLGLSLHAGVGVML
jgi:hypothetical protein